MPCVVEQVPDDLILAIEDLGPLSSLHEFFKPETCDVLAQKSPTELAKCIGQRVGHFFAHLHAPEVIQRVGLSAAAATLRSISKRSLIYKACVTHIEDLLVSLAKQSDEEGGARLARRVEADLLHETSGEEDCFQIGDCHPGCVLISKPADGDAVAVID
jgi:hypothetical protein